MAETVESPCIGVCTMNEQTGYCAGCFRTIEEITKWWEMAPAQQKQVLEMIEQRQQAAFD